MAQVATKPILISGGGLASLLLAQSLRRASLPFIVYERDASISFRAQGYRLRLSDFGIDAVRSVLSAEHFQRFLDACGRTGGDGLRTINAITGEIEEDTARNDSNDGAPKKNVDPEPRSGISKLQMADGTVIGISRGDMRKAFLEGCEENVKWSHEVTGYELTDSGVRAIFADGSKSEEGEMLIGGDGVRSKIAKQLSNGKLKVYDTGSRAIHGQASTAAFKGIGEGVWRIQDEANKVFVITNVRSGDMDDPNIIFGWTMGAAPGVINAPNDDYSILGKPAAQIAKHLTRNWHPRVKPLFDQMFEDDSAFWKITCSTPTGVPEWKNEPRVTVIGDAVHSMTPAGGLGANTAMKDSALLGRLLRESGGKAENVTAAYEKEMRVYASETVGRSYGMATRMFSANINENTPTI